VGVDAGRAAGAAGRPAATRTPAAPATPARPPARRPIRRIWATMILVATVYSYAALQLLVSADVSACTNRPGSTHPRFAGQDGHGVSRNCYCPLNARDPAGAVVPELGLHPVFTVLAGQESGLSLPTGLAFRPDRPCELWAVNSGDNSVVILFNPGSRGANARSSTERRQDSCACHFMSRPSALAFLGGGQSSYNDARRGHPDRFLDPSVMQSAPAAVAGATFVTVHDDDNSFGGGSHDSTHGARRAGNNFMGPTLWSADLTKFAIENNQVFPGNAHSTPEGSHLDMLHEHPFSMGVAWAGRNLRFWSWDGGLDSQYGSLTLSDFGSSDHGYGGCKYAWHLRALMPPACCAIWPSSTGLLTLVRHDSLVRADDHDDGGVRRFQLLANRDGRGNGTVSELRRVPGVSGHMVLDAAGEWLYVADPGNQRVIRVWAQHDESALWGQNNAGGAGSPQTMSGNWPRGVGASCSPGGVCNWAGGQPDGSRLAPEADFKLRQHWAENYT
jgi:hypothetical protein